MNVKQFKRRWLNSKIEPELFYMPVKEKNQNDIEPIILDVFIDSNTVNLQQCMLQIYPTYFINIYTYWFGKTGQKSVFSNFSQGMLCSNICWMPEYNTEWTLFSNYINEYVKKQSSYTSNYFSNSLSIPTGYCPGFYTYDSKTKKYIRADKEIEKTLLTDSPIPEYKNGQLYKMSRYSFFNSEDIYLKVEVDNGKSYKLKGFGVNNNYYINYQQVNIQGKVYYLKSFGIQNLEGLYFSNLFEETGTYRIKIYCKNFTGLYFNSYYSSVSANNIYNRYITKVIDWGKTNLKSLYHFLSYAQIKDDLPPSPEWFKNILYTNEMFSYASIKKISNLNFKEVLTCESFALSSSIEEVDDNLFSNCPNLISSLNMFYGNKSLKKIGKNLLSNCPNLVNIAHAFCNNTSLGEIGEGFLNNSNRIFNAHHLFCNCMNLLKIPDDLFYNKLDLVDVSYIMYGCKKLLKLPANLFKNCKRIVNLYYTFYNCDMLTSIDSSAFAGCTNLRSFNYLVYIDMYNSRRYDNVPFVLGDNLFSDITITEEAIDAGIPSVLYFNRPFYLYNNTYRDSTTIDKKEAIQVAKNACLHYGKNLFNYSIFNNGMYIWINNWYSYSTNIYYTDENSSRNYIMTYQNSGEAVKFYNYIDKICYNFDTINNTGENYLVFSESNTSLAGGQRFIYGCERGEKKVCYDSNYLPMTDDECYNISWLNFFDNYDEIPKENIGKIAPFENVYQYMDSNYWLQPFYNRQIWFAAQVPIYSYSYVDGLLDRGNYTLNTDYSSTNPYEKTEDSTYTPTFLNNIVYYVKDAPIWYNGGKIWYRIDVENPQPLTLAYSVSHRAPREIILSGIKEWLLETGNLYFSTDRLPLKCYSDAVTPIVPMIRCNVEGLNAEFPKTFYDGSSNQMALYYTIEDRDVKCKGVSKIELIDAVTGEILSTIQGVKSKSEVSTSGIMENGVQFREFRELGEVWGAHVMGATYTNAVPTSAVWNDTREYPDGFVAAVDGSKTTYYERINLEHNSRGSQRWITKYTSRQINSSSTLRYDTDCITYSPSGEKARTWTTQEHCVQNLEWLSINYGGKNNNKGHHYNLMAFFFGTLPGTYQKTYINGKGEEVRYSSYAAIFNPGTYTRTIGNTFLTKYRYARVRNNFQDDYYYNDLYGGSCYTVDQLATVGSGTAAFGADGVVLLPTFDSNYEEIAKIMWLGLRMTSIPNLMSQYQAEINNAGEPGDGFHP